MTAPQFDPITGDAAELATPTGALSRRLLLRRSLGAATPVMLTLASMPSHAAAECVNPSGFISRATFNSRHPGGMVCTTNGPTYFANLSDAAWPTPAGSGNTAATQTFKDVFNAIPPGGTNGTTLKVVLTGASSAFAKYCVAAYANALSSPLNYPMTVNQARALWVTIKGGTLPASTSPFPQASLGWDEAKTLDWLASVMNP